MSLKMTIPKIFNYKYKKSSVEVIFQSMESILTRHQKAKEGWYKNHRHLCLHTTSTNSTCSNIWVPGLQWHKEEKQCVQRATLVKAPYSLFYLSQSPPPHLFLSHIFTENIKATEQELPQLPPTSYLPSGFSLLCLQEEMIQYYLPQASSFPPCI